MKKIAMVEYQGRCDEAGNAVGHGPKVLADYYDFICEENEVSIFAPKVVLESIPEKMQKKSKVLPKQIVMKAKNSLWEKIANKFHMFRNLQLAFHSTDAEIIWLFNVEYYLMLYLFLHRKPKQKVVVTMFLDGYHGGMVARFKQWVFECAQKKIDLIVATGEHFTFKNCRSIYIPDYYYVPEKYEAYRTLPKKEQAVCLGTMSSGKQLEEMVGAFCRMDYPLVVAGRFYDEARFQHLQEMVQAAKAENITLINKYLSEAEYLQFLASSKFTVLPYGAGQYGTQTSGVMQEALFTDVIPVSFRAVLGGSSIPGVAFTDWDKLDRSQLQADGSDYYAAFEKLRQGKYNRENVKKNYQIWDTIGKM